MTRQEIIEFLEGQLKAHVEEQGRLDKDDPLDAESYAYEEGSISTLNFILGTLGVEEFVEA